MKNNTPDINQCQICKYFRIVEAVSRQLSDSGLICNNSISIEPEMIINPEAVNTLFYFYGKHFPEETISTWQERFQKQITKCTPIQLDRYQRISNKENNRILLFTILKEIENFIRGTSRHIPGFHAWARLRFGIDFSCAKTRYNDPKKGITEHSQASRIREIIKNLTSF